MTKIIKRSYNHIFERVAYPRERGYRMESKILPDWVHIEIITKEDSKCLIVKSRIHVNKEVKVGPDYSCEFTDNEVIKDLSGEISARFL